MHRRLRRSDKRKRCVYVFANKLAKPQLGSWGLLKVTLAADMAPSGRRLATSFASVLYNLRAFRRRRDDGWLLAAEPPLNLPDPKFLEEIEVVHTFDVSYASVDSVERDEDAAAFGVVVAEGF